MNKQKIILEFRLKPFGQKGWMRGNISCPTCNRNNKFGVLFVDNGGVTRCFYCAESLPLAKVLHDLGRDDLLEFEYEYKQKRELVSLKREAVSAEKEEVELPIGFRRIETDKYLEDRDFTAWQYEQYQVGVSELDPRTEGKLVFQIFQRGQLAGWLARSRKSKEWHKENLKRHKELGDMLVLRYRNSEHDFSKMLGGVDEITDKTHTVILVEGLFDKANVDRLLELNEIEEVKCCFTFGSDLNVDQVELIPKSVSNIIMMYDAGTINNIKGAGGRLLAYFKVYVALLKDEEIDPGNMNEDYMNNLFASMKDFLYFYCHILPNL